MAEGPKIDPPISYYGAGATGTELAAEVIMVCKPVKMVFALPPIDDITPTVTARIIPRMTAYSTSAAPSSSWQKFCIVLSNLRIIIASS
jgi:hypothetical protein